MNKDNDEYPKKTATYVIIPRVAGSQQVSGHPVLGRVEGSVGELGKSRGHTNYGYSCQPCTRNRDKIVS